MNNSNKVQTYTLSFISSETEEKTTIKFKGLRHIIAEEIAVHEIDNKVALVGEFSSDETKQERFQALEAKRLENLSPFQKDLNKLVIGGDEIDKLKRGGLVRSCNDNNVTWFQFIIDVDSMAATVRGTDTFILDGFDAKKNTAINTLLMTVKGHNDSVLWDSFRPHYTTDQECARVLEKVSVSKGKAVFNKDSKKAVKMSTASVYKHSKGKLLNISYKKAVPTTTQSDLNIQKIKDAYLEYRSTLAPVQSIDFTPAATESETTPDESRADGVAKIKTDLKLANLQVVDLVANQAIKDAELSELKQVFNDNSVLIDMQAEKLKYFDDNKKELAFLKSDSNTADSRKLAEKLILVDKQIQSLKPAKIDLDKALQLIDQLKLELDSVKAELSQKSLKKLGYSKSLKMAS